MLNPQPLDTQTAHRSLPPSPALAASTTRAQAPPLGPEQRGLRVRARRPLFLCRRREGVGRPEGGGTAPPRSSWTFTPSLGGPPGGGLGVFPQKLCRPGREPGPAVKGAAKLEKLEPGGRSRGGREAAAKREGRSPCRLAPPAGDHLTAPRVSGRVGASTGRQELPPPLSAGHPCPGNQPPPREGVTREQDAAARPGTQGPQGRLHGGSQQLPGPQERAADEGQMVPPPPGPPRSPHYHPHPRAPQRRRQEEEQGWGWSAGASARTGTPCGREGA